MNKLHELTPCQKEYAAKQIVGFLKGGCEKFRVNK